MNNERYLLEVPKGDPWQQLNPLLTRKAIALRDYMLAEGRFNPDANDTLVSMSQSYLDAGLPLERCVTIVRILHAINSASMRVWENGKEPRSVVIPFVSSNSSMYDRSPSALAHKFKSWVRFNPQTTPNEAFGVVEELKEEGLTDYICAPTFMVNGLQNVFTFATNAPDGFSDENMAFLRATFPAVEACQEILVTHRILKEVTRTYVGDEPHKRILAGDVHRGEVTTQHAAILFTDMRKFTATAATLSNQETTILLNEYFDCIVPPIEANGGEVLKFIGDGVLAIFPSVDGSEDASKAALSAAVDGLNAVHRRNLDTKQPFEIGTALHIGEVAFGNVGSGARLDYTVIGQDVNLTSRVADLCSVLDEKLLLSGDIKDNLSNMSFLDCGSHELKGLAQPVSVFKLKYKYKDKDKDKDKT